MALPGKESNVSRSRYGGPSGSCRWPLPEDECLGQVMKDLLKSSCRQTKVLDACLAVPVNGAICSGRSCCAWNTENVMCCTKIKDDKAGPCFMWPRSEDCLCFKKKGKLYCIT